MKPSSLDFAKSSNVYLSLHFLERHDSETFLSLISHAFAKSISSNTNSEPFLVLAVSVPFSPSYTRPRNFSFFNHFPSLFIHSLLSGWNRIFADTIPEFGVIRGVFDRSP